MSKPTYNVFNVLTTKFELPIRYQFIKPVGSGAYGVVISALDNDSGKRVAVKKVQRAFGNLTDAKRVLREVKLLRAFHHENIINLLDLVPPPYFVEAVASQRPQGKPPWSVLEDLYIVSDLMDTDLYRIIYSKQELSLDHVQYFVYQILRGLKCLHSASVVHRDLKPSNLLLNSNCDLKICDFGLARGILDRPDGEQAEQELTEYVVTRWYRAPEIMLACREYGTPVDLWSVGCIMAELLERKPLFAGDDYIDQLTRICEFVGKPSRAEVDAFVSSPKAKQFLLGLPNFPPQDLHARYGMAGPQAVDLLSRLLAFDPSKRLDAAAALTHPYLASLHLPDDEPDAGFTFDWSHEQQLEGKEGLQGMAFKEVLAFHPELVEPPVLDPGGSPPPLTRRLPAVSPINAVASGARSGGGAVDTGAVGAGPGGGLGMRGRVAQHSPKPIESPDALGPTAGSLAPERDRRQTQGSAQGESGTSPMDTGGHTPGGGGGSSEAKFGGLDARPGDKAAGEADGAYGGAEAKSGAYSGLPGGKDEK